MKKEMLINVLQAEECRIAVVEDGVLEELYLDRSSLETFTGNIYTGRVVNMEPAIQAAFVDFSVGRNGFLHVSDVEPRYYRDPSEEGEEEDDPRDRESSPPPSRRSRPRRSAPAEVDDLDEDRPSSRGRDRDRDRRSGGFEAETESPRRGRRSSSAEEDDFDLEAELPPSQTARRRRSRPDRSEAGRRDRSRRRFGEGLVETDTGDAGRLSSTASSPKSGSRDWDESAQESDDRPTRPVEVEGDSETVEVQSRSVDPNEPPPPPTRSRRRRRVTREELTSPAPTRRSRAEEEQGNPPTTADKSPAGRQAAAAPASPVQDEPIVSEGDEDRNADRGDSHDATQGADLSNRSGEVEVQADLDQEPEVDPQPARSTRGSRSRSRSSSAAARSRPGVRSRSSTPVPDFEVEPEDLDDRDRIEADSDPTQDEPADSPSTARGSSSRRSDDRGRGFGQGLVDAGDELDEAESPRRSRSASSRSEERSRSRGRPQDRDLPREREVEVEPEAEPEDGDLGGEPESVEPETRRRPRRSGGSRTSRSRRGEEQADEPTSTRSSSRRREIKDSRDDEEFEDQPIASDRDRQGDAELAEEDREPEFGEGLDEDGPPRRRGRAAIRSREVDSPRSRAASSGSRDSRTDDPPEIEPSPARSSRRRRDGETARLREDEPEQTTRESSRRRDRDRDSQRDPDRDRDPVRSRSRDRDGDRPSRRSRDRDLDRGSESATGRRGVEDETFSPAADPSSTSPSRIARAGEKGYVPRRQRSRTSVEEPWSNLESDLKTGSDRRSRVAAEEPPLRSGSGLQDAWLDEELPEEVEERFAEVEEEAVPDRRRRREVGEDRPSRSKPTSAKARNLDQEIDLDEDLENDSDSETERDRGERRRRRRGRRGRRGRGDREEDLDEVSTRSSPPSRRRREEDLDDEDEPLDEDLDLVDEDSEPEEDPQPRTRSRSKSKGRGGRSASPRHRARDPLDEDEDEFEEADDFGHGEDQLDLDDDDLEAFDRDEDENEDDDADEEDPLDPDVAEEIRREAAEIAELQRELNLRGSAQRRGRTSSVDPNDRATHRAGRGRGPVKPPIQEVFRRGDEVLVQVIKDSIGTKGPTLSTYISLPGRYLVLMPGLTRVGVSRKIGDERHRRRLRKIMNGLNPPKGLGFIVRTAGMDRTKHELARDMAYLLRLWKTILRRIKKVKGPAAIYAESDMITRTLRDIFNDQIGTVWIDETQAYERAREFLQNVMPKYVDRLKLYDDKVPLFHRYKVEQEIDKIHRRQVPLPEGGSIVIDSTEALVAIDVNSGNFRVENDAERTAYEMNLRAAREIARQLRLRDLGGVIANDFIDMRDERHRRGVERALREAVQRDRARTKILRMSQFGIIEMTRQRIRPSLRRSIYQDCPHCNGTGMVKTAESIVIDVMRLLALAADRGEVARIDVRVRDEVATYLSNRKRNEILELELESQLTIQIRREIDCPADFVQIDCFDGQGSEVRLGQSNKGSTSSTSTRSGSPRRRGGS